MTHDPLCPCTPTGFDIALRARDEFCRCDFIAKVRADQDTKYVNYNYVWGQSECILDCPTCHRLDELYSERSVGYKEGHTNAIKSSIQIIENLPCRCDNGMDYCDGQTDAIESIERLFSNI